VLELRPDSGLELPATDGDGTDGSGSDGDGGTDGGIDGDDADGPSGPDASTGDEAPGFGVVAALLGLLAAVSLLARRTGN
jgi:PGF-CTERM protein